MVVISNNTEITMTRLANKKVNKRFIKVGNTSLTPTIIWDDYLEYPRRVNPPLR